METKATFRSFHRKTLWVNFHFRITTCGRNIKKRKALPLLFFPIMRSLGDNPTKFKNSICSSVFVREVNGTAFARCRFRNSQQRSKPEVYHECRSHICPCYQCSACEKSQVCAKHAYFPLQAPPSKIYK